MEGDCKRSKSGPNGQLPAEAGVIPRAIKQIFDTLESQNAEYSVKVTFLELYNEEITDLLAPEEVSKVALEDRQKKQLPLMEDGKGGVLVRGLEEEIVTSANEIFTLLERGSAKRRTAETLLNKQSSRSHSLFSITIHIKEATPEGEELIKCGKLNLVDLAGSENISRSGAREGRAREAGEINKSLLTLGRVINALVEHLGHVPYRDSKLTRLLRDSLGGRTKTCIIATVSPAVHCLEETLSTLDYAHRAKNIRNKPEVNQKMMKTTLIKELYGEIERLKAELHAAREKNGVYIPKERYHQEENERKAMTDQIELMGVTIENQQKQLEDLRSRYDAEVQQCSDLSNKLDSTEKNLNFIRKLLTGSEEEVKKCKYALKEKEFIISEQKKAEDALSQQACSMRSELEKALQNNASLYSKIAREDKLSADNKSIVISYQENLAEKVGFLCNTVVSSISQQKDRLKYVDSLCHSLLNRHNEAMTDLMNKVMESRTAYVSHIESLQNIVRSHNAESDARLDEITVLASSEARSIEEFLITEAAEATLIHNDLQATLSRHLGEMAVFARELQQRFNDGVEQMKEISLYIGGYLQKIVEELSKLSNHATKKIQEKNISAFQKSFEELSKSNAEKLIADMTSLLMGLVNNHLRCQQEMVNARLNDLRENDKADKAFLDDHVSTMEAITTDAKRKWQEFSVQASNDANDTINLSAVKHCRMEQLVQESMSVAETASKQWKRTHESVNEMSSKQALALGSIVRSVVERHKQHIDEVDTTRCAAERETVRSTEDIAKQLDCWSESQQKVVNGILSSTKAQEDDLEAFRKDHSGQATLIEKETRETFQERYMEYEQTGLTPEKCEPDIPSAGTLQSLRVMPMDELVAEFRETHPYETTNEKHTKPSLIPRSPFAEVN